MKNRVMTLPSATFILTSNKKNTFLGFLISYFLVPLGSLFFALSSIFHPNSVEATMVTYFCFVIMSLGTGIILNLFRDLISKSLSSYLHLCFVLILPFLIWFIWTLSLVN